MPRSVYMYRAGEAKIFASPEEIPAGEGWQDTPVLDLPSAPEAAPAEEPAPKRRKLSLKTEEATE